LRVGSRPSCVHRPCRQPLPSTCFPVCVLAADIRGALHTGGERTHTIFNRAYLCVLLFQFDYSYEHNEVLFMDPAGGGCKSSAPLIVRQSLNIPHCAPVHCTAIETCSPEVLQVARDQQGTDLDVLCIPLPQYEATPDERAAD